MLPNRTFQPLRLNVSNSILVPPRPPPAPAKTGGGGTAVPTAGADAPAGGAPPPCGGLEFTLHELGASAEPRTLTGPCEAGVTLLTLPSPTPWSLLEVRSKRGRASAPRPARGAALLSPSAPAPAPAAPPLVFNGTQYTVGAVDPSFTRCWKQGAKDNLTGVVAVRRGIQRRRRRRRAAIFRHLSADRIVVIIITPVLQADGGVAHVSSGNFSYGIDFAPYSTDELRTVYASLTCNGTSAVPPTPGRCEGVRSNGLFFLPLSRARGVPP